MDMKIVQNPINYVNGYISFVIIIIQIIIIIIIIYEFKLILNNVSKNMICLLHMMSYTQCLIVSNVRLRSNIEQVIHQLGDSLSTSLSQWSAPSSL